MIACLQRFFQIFQHRAEVFHAFFPIGVEQLRQGQQVGAAGAQFARVAQFGVALEVGRVQLQAQRFHRQPYPGQQRAAGEADAFPQPLPPEIALALLQRQQAPVDFDDAGAGVVPFQLAGAVQFLFRQRVFIGPHQLASVAHVGIDQDGAGLAVDRVQFQYPRGETGGFFVGLAGGGGCHGGQQYLRIVGKLLDRAFDPMVILLVVVGGLVQDCQLQIGIAVVRVEPQTLLQAVAQPRAVVPAVVPLVQQLGHMAQDQRRHQPVIRVGGVLAQQVDASLPMTQGIVEVVFPFRLQRLQALRLERRQRPEQLDV